MEKHFRGFTPLDMEKLKEYCSDGSIQHLEKSMRSLEAGRAPTPSFKLYGKTDISVVTDFFTSLQKSAVVVPKWMLEYEQTRQAKFGPQGGYAKWSEMVDDFKLYSTRPTTCHVDNVTLMHFLTKYGSMRISQLALKETLKHLQDADKIEDRAAGWSTFNLKKTDPLAQKVAIELARSGAWQKGYGYVFARYNKLKKRLFMPMPFSSMLKQAVYFVPFLEYIQDDLRRFGKRSSFTFWADKIGFDPCFKIIDEQYLDALYQAHTQNVDVVPVFIQRDFEKMDTTTGTSQYEKLVLPALAKAYHWKKPTEDCIKSMLFTTQAPIITPSGVLYGDHGTASGAEVTNGGETICNDYYNTRLENWFYSKLVRERLALNPHYRGVAVIPVTSVGNGDDGMTILLCSRKHLDVIQKAYSSAASRAAKECGFRVQADKWHFSTKYGLYCQNMVWLEDGHIKHAYPATLILNSIVNPEHEYTKRDWDKDYRDLDIIQKLDNGCGLPYYHELVDYVANGTKFPLLGESEVETARILSKWSEFRKLQPLGERFNRLDYDITKSPTVAYLLSKRS